MPAVSGSPTQVRASVRTLVELSGVPDDAFVDGDLAYVSDVGENYRLIRSLSVPVGKTACFSGTGYWEMLTADATYIQENPVDPATPMIGDALVWNGAAWAPATSSSMVAVCGEFCDLTDQAFIPGSPLVVKYDTTEISQGVVVENDPNTLRATRLKVSASGIYSCVISPQVLHTGGGQEFVTFWLRKMGTNVPRSASSFEMGNNNNRVLPYIEIVIDLLANQYIEWVFLAQTGTNVSLEHYAEVIGPPAVPAIPSVIASVKRIGT